jgi:hypothetical protein
MQMQIPESMIKIEDGDILEFQRRLDKTIYVHS